MTINKAKNKICWVRSDIEKAGQTSAPARLTALRLEQEALLFEIGHYFTRILFRSHTRTVPSHCWRNGRFIRVIHTGETHRLAVSHCLAGFGVQAFHVTLLADFYGAIHKNFDEALADHLTGLFTCGTIGADGSADDCAAGV